MARYETEFREYGRLIARARGGRPEIVIESLLEQIEQKYNSGENNGVTKIRR
jgi:hypothetical protein